MSKVDRYYISKEYPAVEDIVIRDRMSPHANDTYPLDIAVSLPKCMFPAKKLAEIAEKICKLLNEEL